MNDYSEHIAVIGAGIAGLSLGCFLLRNNIKPIIAKTGMCAGGSGINAVKLAPIGNSIKYQ